MDFRSTLRILSCFMVTSKLTFCLAELTCSLQSEECILRINNKTFVVPDRTGSDVCLEKLELVFAEDDFLQTPGGLAVIFVVGAVTGTAVTVFICLLCLKFRHSKATKEDNTYVDLDLSIVDSDDQPPAETKQRGSVAFVREITSVYYKDTDIRKDTDLDKTRPASTKSRIFSWASSSSRKSALDRKSSLGKTNNGSPKQLFVYEQPVLEESIDCIDLDTPTGSTGTSVEGFPHGNNKDIGNEKETKAKPETDRDKPHDSASKNSGNVSSKENISDTKTK